MYPLSRMLLIWCLLAVIVIVIVLVIIIWFGNRSNDRSCYTIWLSLLKSERSKTWFTVLMNHALTSNHPPRSICVHPLDRLELRLDLLPRPSPMVDLVEADVDVPWVRPGLVVEREDSPLALPPPDPERRWSVSSLFSRASNQATAPKDA